MKHFFLLFVLSVCFFPACKKDKDEQEPDVTIYSPAVNQNYNVLDTIKIQARVSDETKLTSVQVVLQDMNNINVQNAVPISIQGKDFQFQIDYILYDIHLTSGTYKIAVIASDGTNTEVAGAIINITEFPLAKRYYYFANESGSTTTITRYDSVFSNPNIISYPGKFVGLSSSSWYQRLYIAPEINADFSAYNAYNHQLMWTIQDLGAGNPYISTVDDGDDKNVFVGYYDGRLMMYNYTGTIYANYQTGSTSFYPAFIFVSGNYVFAGMKDLVSASKQLRRFDKLNGVQQSQTNTNWLPVGMSNKSSGEYFVAGNDNNGQAVLNIHYTSTGGFYSPYNMPTGSVLSATGVDADYFLIAHSDGNIYKYQYSTNSLLSVYSGLQAKKMVYNVTLNELYVSSGTMFYIFNVAPYSLQLKQSFSHTANIDDFEVVFNK